MDVLPGTTETMADAATTADPTPNDSMTDNNVSSALLVGPSSSSSYRVVEHASASLCRFEVQSEVDSNPIVFASAAEAAAAVTPNEENTSTMNAPPSSCTLKAVTVMDPSNVVRIAPMASTLGGWDAQHFNEDLKLPSPFNIARDGLLVTLEAMANECVAVALSPEPDFIMGKTYAIHIGANGNLSTVIRRRLPNGHDCVDDTFSSLKICNFRKWIPYWIALYKGKLSVGVGRQPGHNTVGTLDDSFYEALRAGPDAVRYVGLGNSVVGPRGGGGGRRRGQIHQQHPLKMRHVKVTGLPTHLLESTGRKSFPTIEIGPHTLLNLHNMDPSTTTNHRQLGATTNADDDEWNALLKEYEMECARGRARAKKFGSVYKEPPPDAFFRWSEARRLRANPLQGFVTGFDTTSAEERAKQQARLERFEMDKKRMLKRKLANNNNDDDKNDEEDGGDDNDNPEENVDDMSSTGADIEEDDDEGKSTVPRPPLPVIQAWDNEELTRELRSDPPFPTSSMNVSGENNADGTTTSTTTATQIQPTVPKTEEEDDIAIGVVEAPNDSTTTAVEVASTKAEPSESAMDDEAPLLPPELVPEKIHIFSNDWAAFKQIRSDDIMAYFAVYGPSYVEWLGELSCNVLFEDKYSAARALMNMSQAIPSPPPSSESLSGGGDDNHHNYDNPQTDDADVVPATKAGDSIDQAGADEMIDETKGGGTPTTLTPDLGLLGWRFCIRPIRKMVSDRFGKRGTRARLLMRLANTDDVLDKKPEHKPRPPSGFTTTRVLGPGSDFDTRWRRKQKKHNNNNNNRNYNNNRGGDNDNGGRRYGNKRQRRQQQRGDDYYDNYRDYDDELDYDSPMDQDEFGRAIIRSDTRERGGDGGGRRGRGGRRRGGDNPRYNSSYQDGRGAPPGNNSSTTYADMATSGGGPNLDGALSSSR